MGPVGWPVGAISQKGSLEVGRFSLLAAAVVVEPSERKGRCARLDGADEGEGDRLLGSCPRWWIPVAARVTGLYGDGNARLPSARTRAVIGAPLGETPSPPAWCW